MRIAHCSDLHLLSLEGAKALDFANKRWIGGLNLLSNRGRHYHAEVFEAMVDDFNRSAIDHVVVTGDITNLAFDGEFRFARAFFDRIELGPEHVTVIPGNHDAYVAEGGRFFSEHFAPYSSADADWAWPVDNPKDLQASWPRVRVRGDLAVIGLSTSLATPWFTAYGRIGRGQLERLESALADPRLAGKLRLVAIHHPPAGPRARSIIRGLRDRGEFARVLAEAGAELVLHGHEHVDMREELPGPDGPIHVRGIQSGTYEAGKLPRRARYRIYELGPAGSRPAIVSDSLRVWDPDRAKFTPDTAPPGPPAAA